MADEQAELEVPREWSDLPIDVVGCIVGKLGCADRIRFCAVCKAWQLPLCPTPVIEENPWMLSFVNDEGSENRVMKLLKPYRNGNYIVKEFHGKENALIRGYFWASRYGWILCNKAKHLPDDSRYVLSTFLFSPFTGEMIEFPELDAQLDKDPPPCVPLTTFFICPSSPECAVYALWRRIDLVCMATCSPGDKAWKTFMFPLPGFGEFLPYGITYLAGSFYSISTKLEVGAFNLALEEWQLLSPSGRRPKFFSDMNYYGTIVHSDADLLWYECENVASWGDYGCSSTANVWKFDFSKKRWIKERRLGNRTIFSSQYTTYSVGGYELAGMVFTDDEFVCINARNIERSESWSYNEFYKWMSKEKKSKALTSMWVDPRPVWRKSDLVKHREVSSSTIL